MQKINNFAKKFLTMDNVQEESLKGSKTTLVIAVTVAIVTLSLIINQVTSVKKESYQVRKIEVKE